MSSLAKVMHYEVWILLAGLAAVFTYGLLTGAINMRGLLCDKSASVAKGGPGRFSPGRLQMLIFTVGGALYYLMLVMGNEKPGEFPKIPDTLLLMLGGSHAVYLGGKLLPLLASMFGTRRG